VANGTILKSFTKYPSHTAGKQEIKELKKTTTMDTAHTHTQHTHCRN
jgi:hypothetical protein